ncbi:hypothetical protein [Chryseobacterium taklimakanense]|uniref:hypothetical protein n=1 Tax=Chryseobacterium taklimakanense TaxID=536441 RepID=UPI000BA35571|nr:hypothetical protein [Chryseobacterium taklimakanense]
MKKAAVKTVVWNAERKCFLLLEVGRWVLEVFWKGIFFQYGIRLCAVKKATGRLVRAVAEGTWKIPKQSVPFFCILEWVAGI